VPYALGGERRHGKVYDAPHTKKLKLPAGITFAPGTTGLRVVAG
jgi:hypothetical protein